MSNRIVAVDPSDPSRAGAFDTHFQSPVVVQHHDAELHAGQQYTASYYSAALTPGGMALLAFKTPPGPMLIHFRCAFGTSAGGNIALREGSTWTQGTGILARARERNRANVIQSALLQDKTTVPFTANGSIIADPTILVSGQVLHRVYAFGANKVPADASGLEFILAPDTQYSVEVTTAAGGDVQVAADWTEHIPS